MFLGDGAEANRYYQETFGLSVVEAQAAGLPVVASAVGGIPETVADGAGILVPPGDAVALTDALQELIRTPGEWDAMGRRGRRHVEQSFDQQKIQARLEELYRSLAVAGLP